MKTGVALAGLAGLAALVGFARTRGYTLDPARAKSLVSLEPWEFCVVAAAARRIAAPDRDDPSIPSADVTDVAGFVDGFVAGMASTMRRDLGRLLAYVEHVAPLRSGFRRRFTDLPAEAQDQILAGLETAREGLLRGGFEGLKALVFMGYYRDPRTWRIAGYDGPTWMRPAGGWK